MPRLKCDMEMRNRKGEPQKAKPAGVGRRAVLEDQSTITSTISISITSTPARNSDAKMLESFAAWRP